ncbi:MAG: FMN-binding protein [Deferrisomatales bacterium]
MKDWPAYPVVFMVLLCAVCGAAVSSVAVLTRERVEAGEQARRRAHVLGAFGLEAPADPAEIDRVWARTIEERTDEGGAYVAARDAAGNLLGYGFPFTGPGFWGPISGVVALDPTGRKILGLSFTKHQETPGLGGRIAEEWFRRQFRGKPVDPPPGGGPPLRFVYRRPEGPREVEAITGATQTSSRLEAFLNPFLAELRRRPALRGGGGG